MTKQEMDKEKLKKNEMKKEEMEKEEGEKDEDPDMDRGYAWVILAGCFVMYCLVIGSVKGYGILYTEMVVYYGSGSGNTAWIGSMVLLLLLGMSPVINLLSRKFSFRRVAFMGGLLICLGFFLSGFVRRMELMFLTLGICGGLGYGSSFSPCSTIISYYFKKHRALANGIVVSGSGIGALAFPTLYRMLIESYSLPGALWIIGAILSHVCAAACLFRQPPLLLKVHQKEMEAKKRKQNDSESLLKHKDSNNTENTKKRNKKNKDKCCGIDFRFSLFRNVRFTMYCAAFILCMNGYGNNLILIPSHILALGYDKDHMVYAVTIMGGCEVVARIGFGWLADQKLLKRKHIFLVSMFIAAIFSFLAPFFKSFVFMAIYAAIIGIFPGSFWSLVSVLIIDVVGISNFTPAFGLVMLCLAIGVAISQPTIGWLEDATGNWHVSFVVTGFLFLFACIIVLMEPVFVRLCGKSDTDSDVMQENGDVRLQNVMIAEVTSDETGSLIDDNGGNVTFTSPRISRIYRPYDSDKHKEKEPSSPAPIFNTNEM